MRIWVTGLGVVSPLGLDASTTMAALVAGRRAFGEVTLFDTAGCRSTIAAEIADLDVSDVAPAAARSQWSRTDAMAVIAAREALDGLAADMPSDLIVGGTTAGMFETEDLLAEMHRAASARRPTESMRSHPLSATVDRMQTAVRHFSRATTLCSACSGGTNALLLAASWLRSGRSQRVLAGGADGLCRLTFTGFSCLGALSPDPCRPFHAQRAGLNLGEGAAFLLLETEDAARNRGAEPIAELRGWAMASEAHHITHPQASGEVAAAVMSAALRRADLTPQDIDYINAHGTATPLNDKMEATAIARAFGDETQRIGVSSSKSMIGHTLGAAGAIEAAICCLAIARGVVPATVALDDIDPDCQLAHILTARHAPIRAAVSNSFGFGGSDAAVVLAAPGQFGAPASSEPRRVVVTAAATLSHGGLHDNMRPLTPLPSPSEPPAGAIPFEAGEHLTLSRARRIDRAGRLGAATMQAAITATFPNETPLSSRTGAIMGRAYGSVDACAAFLDRVRDKGARFASPAVFPNLLPSSSVAHASIYHRLTGPVFSMADLDASSEAAIVTAALLIATGEAEAMLAGGVEEASDIAETVLVPLCGFAPESATERSEGGAMLMLEARDGARERGATVMAEIVWCTSWRGAPTERLRDAPRMSERAAVMVAHQLPEVHAALAGSDWTSVPCHAIAMRVGAHAAAGGIAAAIAAFDLAAGHIEAALVLGLAADRGYAFVMQRPGMAASALGPPAAHQPGDPP